MTENKLYRMFIRWVACLMLGVVSNGAFANVTLPAIFSDHMVLQQKTKVQFWGWAAPGEMVTVSPGWKTTGQLYKVEANGSGEWRISLPTSSWGGPYTISIKGNNQLILHDVMIGEVWVCSGQSNMTFTLKSSDHATDEIAKANFDGIRYFSVARQYGNNPFKDGKGAVWEKTSSETAPDFSAVAYFFAKKIHLTLKVPVGIILSAWGGTPAEAWTPKSVLQQDTALSQYIDRWKKIQDNVGKDSVAYHQAMVRWEDHRSSGDSNRFRKPKEPQTLYYYKRPWREPGVLFNGMIHPILPYTIKGVLWYQGESNVAYAGEYEYLFSTMIRTWRTDWERNGPSAPFPFYFVQIAPYGYNNLEEAALLRQAQYEVSQKIKNTGMAVTVDLGNMKNIHFTHKKEVGDRLALLALAKDYGRKQLLFQGPECIKVSQSGGKINLSFDRSLQTYNHNEAGGFEIGYKIPGKDSVYYVKAASKIQGNNVMVWDPAVKEEPMVWVRYAWLEIAEAKLTGKEGLPVRPFIKQLVTQPVR